MMLWAPVSEMQPFHSPYLPLSIGLRRNSDRNIRRGMIGEDMQVNQTGPGYDAVGSGERDATFPFAILATLHRAEEEFRSEHPARHDRRGYAGKSNRPGI